MQQHKGATVQGTVQAASLQSLVADEDATVQGVTATRATAKATFQPIHPRNFPSLTIRSKSSRWMFHRIRMPQVSAKIDSHVNNIMTVEKQELFFLRPLLLLRLPAHLFLANWNTP